MNELNMIIICTCIMVNYLLYFVKKCKNTEEKNLTIGLNRGYLCKNEIHICVFND